MMRACGVAAVIAVTAGTRVTVWPGWSVPLAAVILATALAALGACAAIAVTVVVSRVRRPDPACCGRCADTRPGVRVLSLRLTERGPDA